MNLRASVLFAFSMGCLLLSGCDQASETVVVEETPTTPPSASATPSTEGETGNPSLFSMGPEHEKAMKDREAEMEATNQRIEELARKRNLAMVEEQLNNLHANYLALYQEHIIGSTERNMKDLNTKHLQALQELQASIRLAEGSVLGEELNKEIERATMGETIPPPPPADSTANPGLEPIYRLRSWYEAGYANVTRARDATLLNLTNAHHKDLTVLKVQADESLPDYAAAVVAKALNDFDPGGWWKIPAKSILPDPQ